MSGPVLSTRCGCVVGFPGRTWPLTRRVRGAWRDDYISTFLERDLANLGVRIPAVTMRRFWTMIAHYHGQVWNGAELARAIGVSQGTVRRYLDALTEALAVRQLQPWYAKLAKRQVRSPKVYVRDSGLLHRLLNIADRNDLLGHPKVGASWEGFVIEQILMLDVHNPWFWGTHTGAELDLMVDADGERVGVEVKRTDQPRHRCRSASWSGAEEGDRAAGGAGGFGDGGAFGDWSRLGSAVEDDQGAVVEAEPVQVAV